jgi:hypothetical protein
MNGLRGWLVSAWCVTAGFGAYFCMYAFRKPFTAADYDAVTVWGLEFKPLLVVTQTLGYCLSKFVGIKVVSEVSPGRRAGLLLGLVGAGWVALLLFAVTPPPGNAVWLFANGVPLGMVFGLVLGFLEGRRQTEALTAGLCCSFIVADGVVKSVGAGLVQAGVNEYWMPFAAGGVFVLPLVVFTWMLTRVPPPTAEDVAARSERVPMGGGERWAMFRRYTVGFVLLMLAYLLVTVLRSVRADFAPEIWAGLLGEKVPAEVYGWSEVAVAVGVTAVIGVAVLLRDNRRAFFAGLGAAAVGSVLLVAALAGWAGGGLGAFPFMVLCGVGLYLPYIAVHTIIFERLIAMTRDRGNIGYLMYLVDSFGYLGYVGVLLGKNLFTPAGDFLAFFLPLSWVIGLACVVLLVPCWRYFATHPATRGVAAEPGPVAGAIP